MILTDFQKKQYSLDALKAWHNQALNYPENYSFTFEQLVAWIDKSNSEWRNNFGSSVQKAQEYLGNAAVNSAMENLADTAKGRVTTFPDGFFKGNEFFEALQGKVLSWDFKRIVIESGKIANAGLDAIADKGKWAIGGIAGLWAIVPLVGVMIVILSYKKK